MLPGRDHDRFGIGFYYTNLSSDLPGIFLSSNEIGLEVFYNIAATNWLYVTPDIQVIEPAGKRATTAFLTGLRLQIELLASKIHSAGVEAIPCADGPGANRSRDSRELNRRSAPVSLGVGPKVS